MGLFKDAIRRVDVEKLVKFVNEIVEEWPMVQNKSFVELCDHTVTMLWREMYSGKEMLGAE